MGAHLSEPVTEKDTHRLQNDLLSVASSAMQGWRISTRTSRSCWLCIFNAPLSHGRRTQQRAQVWWRRVCRFLGRV